MIYTTINRADFKATNIISKIHNTEWRTLAGRNCIGDCSKNFQRLHPDNYYDFYLLYTHDGEETADNRDKYKDRGRSEEEVIDVALRYMKKCDDDRFSFEQYLKNVYCHIIVETFDGQIKERCVEKMLHDKGYTWEKPDGDEDTLYGIDFKVLKEGNLKFMLQVKPISFFKGNKNKSLINDRKNAFVKRRLTKQKYGVDTLFMVYDVKDDGTVEWLNEDGKLTFRLERLCVHDSGMPYCLPYERCVISKSGTIYQETNQESERVGL